MALSLPSSTDDRRVGVVTIEQRPLHGYTAMAAPTPVLDPENSAQFLTDLGFLLTPDVPDESASLTAYLLVALRPVPTLCTTTRSGS